MPEIGFDFGYSDFLYIFVVTNFKSHCLWINNRRSL